YGIKAINNGSGALTITSYGTVTGTTGSGIFVSDNNAPANVILQHGSTVSGATGITSDANTAMHLSLDGLGTTVSVTGTGGTAIQMGNQNDTLTMHDTVNIHSDVKGGAGNDTLHFGAGTINMLTAGHDTISGFEAFDDSGHTILNGNFDAT